MTPSEERLKNFGKLGLLIDDAPLASQRVARELYGAEVLPEWWVHVSTLDDAIKELAACVAPRDAAAVTSERQDQPILVVVDRFLPPTSHEPPCYWETAARPDCERFRKQLGQLEARNKQLTQLVAITSYPRRDSASSSLEWKPRFHEPLFRLRRQILNPKAHGLQPLLRYCSASSAPAAASTENNKATYLAKHADLLIKQLARRLLDRATWEVVLLTGAGMSAISDTKHAGIPWNDWLLTQAARSTLQQRDLNGGTTPVLTSILEQCREQGEVCMSQLSGGGGGYGFNSLFSDLAEEKLDATERTFRRNFQRAVMRYDVGLCYQHWLAARLPFDLIVSTNFDGFHERASAHFAATHGTGENLRLRSIIKPYGTAGRRGPIAFSERQFREGMAGIAKELHQALNETPKKKIQLVVVGYSCKDEAIPLQLGSLLDAWRGNSAEGRKVELLWVVPEAYDALRNYPQASSSAGFRHYHERLFTDPAGTVIAEPLPVRAIDFFYDLWNSFHAVRSEEH